MPRSWLESLHSKPLTPARLLPSLSAGCFPAWRNCWTQPCLHHTNNIMSQATLTHSFLSNVNYWSEEPLLLINCLLVWLVCIKRLEEYPQAVRTGLNVIVGKSRLSLPGLAQGLGSRQLAAREQRRGKKRPDDHRIFTFTSPDKEKYFLTRWSCQIIDSITISLPCLCLFQIYGFFINICARLFQECASSMNYD